MLLSLLPFQCGIYIFKILFHVALIQKQNNIATKLCARDVQTYVLFYAYISCQSHEKFNLTFFSPNRRLQASAVGQGRELACLLDLPWRGRPRERRRLGHRGSHRPEQERHNPGGCGVQRVHGERRKKFFLFKKRIFCRGSGWCTYSEIDGEDLLRTVSATSYNQTRNDFRVCFYWQFWF